MNRTAPALMQSATTRATTGPSPFTRFANHVAALTGRPVTFTCAGLVIVVWGLSGPLFHYSDTWQLVINTSTTIVTFLMVFVIQNAQNRDGEAIQIKLDELIRVSADARNKMIGIEKLDEKQVRSLEAEMEELRDDVESHIENGTPSAL